MFDNDNHCTGSVFHVEHIISVFYYSYLERNKPATNDSTDTYRILCSEECNYFQIPGYQSVEYML